MTDLKCLTTREVARLCRVSDATVKRWAEADLLKSERTNGGHRRFRAEEVARFQRDLNLGLKITHGDESIAKAKSRRLESIGQTGSPLFNSLLAGCEEGTAKQLIDSHLNGTPLVEIFDSLISAVMCEVGERWASGELTVTQEHVATRAAFAAMHKLRNVLPVPQLNGNVAMCCAIEGDLHELPTYMAQLTIENEGWEVINFGATTPVYGLIEEIAAHPPKLVCISATVIVDPERLFRDYREFREKASRLRIPVILGGRAFSEPRMRERFPAELYAGSFAEVAEFVRTV